MPDQRHAGPCPGWLHFGLGVETATSATITWPDGTKSDYPDLKANGFHTLTKGEAAVAVTPRD